MFSPIELLSIACDASFTHMYAPGVRRHIKGALKAGASMEEIMEVLKLCVVQGVQACNLGVPILAEELARPIASEPLPVMLERLPSLLADHALPPPESIPEPPPGSPTAYQPAS